MLAHAVTQSYFSGETAYELARLIGLGWVPGSYPVEVVLNGTNIGVYAFSETVRIDPGRVEIVEQPEENTDEETIPYGWLVEIDNTYDTPQIEVPQSYGDEPAQFVSRFTIKTPEVISPQQKEWITDQMTTLTQQILSPDKTTAAWTDKINIESLAKYYIVQELSGNYDAFVGSTYMYKGAGDQWIFGPIWDSEWTFVNAGRTGHIWDERVSITGSEYVNYTWIKDIIKFPEFQQEVRRIWNDFYPSQFNKIYGFIDKFYNLTKDGYETNNLVWPDYISNDIHVTYNHLKRNIGGYAAWFEKLVVHDNFVGVSDIWEDPDSLSTWYTIQGVKISGTPKYPGYIERRGNQSRKTVIGSDKLWN